MHCDTMNINHVCSFNIPLFYGKEQRMGKGNHQANENSTVIAL